MNPFYNSAEERLRAGWRILLQLLIMALLLGGFFFLTSLLVPNPGFLLTTSVSMVGFTLSIWIATRFLDKRSFSSLGIELNREWMKDFAVGFGMAALAMGIIFIVELSTGWITFSGYGWEREFNVPYPLPLLGYFVGMLMVGFYEELFSRGYHIINMTEGFSSKWFSVNHAALLALLISSSIFGILHAANPNASLISTVNIIFAGVVLGIPYLVTGKLAIPVGLHAAWNFFQGGIFGFPVSGSPHRSALLQIRETGPNLITGGSFGPEAGLMGIMGLILIVILFYFYTRKADYPIQLHDSFSTKRAD